MTVTDAATKKCKYSEEKNSRVKLFKDQREPECAPTERRGMRAIFQQLKMPVKDTPA